MYMYIYIMKFCIYYFAFDIIIYSRIPLYRVIKDNNVSAFESQHSSKL